MKTEYDAVVIGAGHAGVEAALALARTGNKTLMITLSLNSISFLACNPSIGGTAKGHLVREIDALGGQMGVCADDTALQLKLLNSSKGNAVKCLRSQTDKIMYHLKMKQTLENQENLTLLESEVSEILIENNNVKGVKTTLGINFKCKAIVIATGVYLNASIIIGDFRKNIGPQEFSRASFLTDSLTKNLNLPLRRFKTGTPARINKNSVDFNKFKIEYGDELIYGFSFLNEEYIKTKNIPCYLGYTNKKTHEIILKNIDRSPLYNGSIKSVGPRYCPSIEDKIMRFQDKEKHQIFLEPESEFSTELYVQGMSSSLPFDVQEKMYKSIEGLENVQIMRYAYAIEYDCLDPLCLDPTLKVKNINGLYTAGQINGSSGYEEAAGQGLVAGLNASLFLKEKEPLILKRNNSYIGVLIDDLVTKGTNEPYRMMTARSEYRLYLRQENADIRLTPIGREKGLVDDYRMKIFENKIKELDKIREDINIKKTPKQYKELFQKKEEAITNNALTFKDMLKRTNIKSKDLIENFDELKKYKIRNIEEIETEVKYEGYLQKQNRLLEEFEKLESKKIPENFSYKELKGLRIEAIQKLEKIKPKNLGQASRISGVSPSDITVLLIYLKNYKNGKI